MSRRFPRAVSGVMTATPGEYTPPVAFSFLKTDDLLKLGDATPEDAFSLHINRAMTAGLNVRRPRSHETHWMRLNGCSIYDLSDLPMMSMSTRFDMIRVYMPRSALEHAAQDANRPRPVRLISPSYGFQDEVLASLAATVESLFKLADAPPTLLIDHLALCIQVHLLHRYSETPPVFPTLRGGLAGWQFKRAQDILMSRLDQDVTLAELAGACGLSNRHFSRAFRESTGLAPFQWLAAKRLEVAREMIVHTTLPINEIAKACGYSDQSHLTRTYRRRFETTPGDDRRRNGGSVGGFIPRSLKE